ncbi:hypothetical protein PRUPE_7G187100 [Prunus persica]|uniref:Uncharacterized protein n=1 Tax=Prunus persica TaxID=3760 RepID=A0A251NDH7_PRUPE|nr:hypothetical protein PRUPE_7G187100 [Prunus persica]
MNLKGDVRSITRLFCSREFVLCHLKNSRVCGGFPIYIKIHHTNAESADFAFFSGFVFLGKENIEVMILVEIFN